MLSRDALPVAPFGDRVLLRPDPSSADSAGGLLLPEKARGRVRYFGTLLDAGLLALDKLADNGISVGDVVYWERGKGCVEDWDHVTHEVSGCAHSWGFAGTPFPLAKRYTCECGAERMVEPLLVINADDILPGWMLGRNTL